jgi:hypothetical protein
MKGNLIIHRTSVKHIGNKLLKKFFFFFPHDKHSFMVLSTRYHLKLGLKNKRELSFCNVIKTIT